MTLLPPGTCSAFARRPQLCAQLCVIAAAGIFLGMVHRALRRIDAHQQGERSFIHSMVANTSLLWGASAAAVCAVAHTRGADV